MLGLFKIHRLPVNAETRKITVRNEVSRLKDDTVLQYNIFLKLMAYNQL